MITPLVTIISVSQNSRHNLMEVDQFLLFFELRASQDIRPSLAFFRSLRHGKNDLSIPNQCLALDYEMENTNLRSVEMEFDWVSYIVMETISIHSSMISNNLCFRNEPNQTVQPWWLPPHFSQLSFKRDISVLPVTQRTTFPFAFYQSTLKLKQCKNCYSTFGTPEWRQADIATTSENCSLLEKYRKLFSQSSTVLEHFFRKTYISTLQDTKGLSRSFTLLQQNTVHQFWPHSRVLNKR